MSEKKIANARKKQCKVTEGRFKAAKILLESGATYAAVAEAIGCAASTVWVIKASETYEEYKNRMYLQSSAYRKKMIEEQNKKKLEETPAPVKEEEKQEAPVPQEADRQVVEHRQTVTIQATHYMMEEMRKTNEMLKTISAKLAFIVDELTK